MARIKDAIANIAAAVPAVVILIPRVGMDKPATTVVPVHRIVKAVGIHITT